MNQQVAGPAEPTYAARKSVLEQETIWRLTPSAITRDRVSQPPQSAWGTIIQIAWRVLFPFATPLGADNWPDRVEYMDIHSIRVRFDPTRFDRTRERCDLIGPDGEKASLFSTSFVSFGQFEDRSVPYRAFVDELTQRVLAVRSETPIYSGLSWKSYIFQHGFLLLMLLLFSSVLGAIGAPAFGTIWAKVAITLSYIGLIWTYAKRNFPGKINPPKRLNR